ncbi:hypothetical protein LTR15_011164 [Elasticomyces elasticus]|nr:hypothetical protein LTR15_011164 [Elasticomyces elasticus]
MSYAHNETQFFHVRYKQALQAWQDGELGEADDICRGLVADFPCPLFVQVQAWQLRSLCTDQYYQSRSYLQNCFPILEKHVLEDPLVKRLHDYTTESIAQLDRNWAAKWAASGQKPPTERDLQRLEEKEDIAAMETEAARDQAVEETATGMSLVTLEEDSKDKDSSKAEDGSPEGEGSKDWAREETDGEMEDIRMGYEIAARIAEEERTAQEARVGENDVMEVEKVEDTDEVM